MRIDESIAYLSDNIFGIEFHYTRYSKEGKIYWFMGILTISEVTRIIAEDIKMIIEDHEGLEWTYQGLI